MPNWHIVYRVQDRKPRRDEETTTNFLRISRNLFGDERLKPSWIALRHDPQALMARRRPIPEYLAPAELTRQPGLILESAESQANPSAPAWPRRSPISP